MHRTSRILALTALLFAAGAALFFIKAAALPYKVAYPVLLLAAALLALLFAGVVPRVLDPAERIGVAVYGAVIAGMLYTVLRYRGAYAAWFRFAALLFVFSDGVIAWSRFIGAVPGRTYVVMVPYYLAQCLFFCFAVKSLPARPSEGRSV